jgi:hypothetical protein
MSSLGEAVSAVFGLYIKYVYVGVASVTRTSGEIMSSWTEFLFLFFFYWDLINF